MTIQIPDASTLKGLHADIDKTIEALTTVLDFATKYGQFIPGVAPEVGILKEVDSALKAAKTFLDVVPA